MCLDLLLQGTYILKIFASSWRIGTFIASASFVFHNFPCSEVYFKCYLIISAYLVLMRNTNDVGRLQKQFTLSEYKGMFFKPAHTQG